ncbi:hypothetical protein C7M61_000604 [Candidozyma pseudohaemuli]|uniref:Autophagy-related protein 2 n=1 Tax=Candidozyma pseudohaemuli TaxID=418784 RepID=A0A2P7YY87_9ASCO|nr:hypothetical protein C7M61_000604 [[Candida] pseudohaemulonii]PSK40938.1 hypothetical protein C7M61_000604 [[Candida] pseudohaemulonii]
MATHEDLPSLDHLRLIAAEAKEWLLVNYWDHVVESAALVPERDRHQTFTSSNTTANLRVYKKLRKQALDMDAESKDEGHSRNLNAVIHKLKSDLQRSAQRQKLLRDLIFNCLIYTDKRNRDVLKRTKFKTLIKIYWPLLEELGREFQASLLFALIQHSSGRLSVSLTTQEEEQAIPWVQHLIEQLVTGQFPISSRLHDVEALQDSIQTHMSLLKDNSVLFKAISSAATEEPPQKHTFRMPPSLDDLLGSPKRQKHVTSRMSPQWMPQNLQKRLLLYILQQLLLFSEIDLPNLEEVSLSNIQLKDVSLDPEKVGKLPGFTLRFGELKTVEVKGGVVGGVNLNITGVEVVLATKIDDLDKELKNMLALLAQSTVNLANTVMFESDLRDSSSVVPESESDSDTESKPSSSGSGESLGSQTRSSALGGVMSRALEIALLRLQVNIADVNIKIMSDSVDFLISVKNISFSTTNRQHSVKVESLKVSTLRPDLDPGHGVERAPEVSASDSESEQDERSSEDDSADESLMSSTVFTHEEASSVYMSATAQSFKPPEVPANDSSVKPVHLLYVDEVDLNFEGMSPLTNLQIDVGTLRLAAVPLTPTISLLVNSISKVMKLKSHQLRKQHATTRSSARNASRPSSSLSNASLEEVLDLAGSPQPQHEALFEKLHVAELLLNLTLAIDDNGEFASEEDELILAAYNTNVKLKNEALVFGGIETFKILKLIGGLQTEIFHFVAEKPNSRSSSVSIDAESSTSGIQHTRADIRFEYFRPEAGDESPETTVLLSKLAQFELDADSLLYILNFSEASQALLENLVTTKDSRLPTSLGHLMFVGQRRFGKHQPKPMFRHSEMKHKASLSLHVTSFEFTLLSLFPRFGDLMLVVNELAFMKISGAFNGFVGNIEAVRKQEQAKVRESLLNRFPDTGPVIVLSYDSSEKGSAIDFVIRKVIVHYYTHWIQLFERNVSQTHKTEGFVHAATPSGGADQQNKVDLRFSFWDLIISLNPGRLSSQVQLATERAVCDFTFAREQFYVKSSFRNVALFLIDDWRNLIHDETSTELKSEISAGQWLKYRGYLRCGHANSTHVGITVNTDIDSLKARHEKLGIRGDISLLDIKLNSDEHLLELCADSYQTLIQLLNDLKVPVTFKDAEKFRYKVDSPFSMPNELLEQLKDLQLEKPSDTCAKSPAHSRRDSSDLKNLERSISDLKMEEASEGTGASISFMDEHFRDENHASHARILPMSLIVNLTKANIYLFDGYDWKLTRKSLRQAVKNMEKKINAIRLKKKSDDEKSGHKGHDASAAKVAGEVNSQCNASDSNSAAPDEEADEVNEVLFQSIYLGMPGDGTASNLVTSMNTEMQAINMETAKDEALYPSLNVDVEKQYKDLKLKRSRIHKVWADIENVEVYVQNYTNRDPRVDKTPEDIDKEMVNKVEITLDSLTIFDNVPSSSWNKFLTYMNAIGEREVGTYMLQFTMMNVRPDPKLPFTEVVMDIKTLPLRLYVDQDTLMFLGRFFQFKDNRFNLPVDEPIFVQRLDISPIRLKFDYKPKSMNYSGFRAGQNAELANLFILDSADLKLAKTKLYGILGFPNLGEALKEAYVPYIQKYQLAGLLSGLAPIKSIINIGEGFRNLVAIPFQEYKNNGQVMKSIQKSSKSLTKTTASELLKLAVKLASGTQNVLESLEKYVGGEGNRARDPTNPNLCSKKLRRNSNEFSTLQQHDEKRDLMQASQLLKKSVPLDDNSTEDRKLYSVMLMDDLYEEDDLDLDGMEGSVLVLDSKTKDGKEAEDDSDDELDEEELEIAEKIVSLYSNQPTTTREGLQFAYKALGKNLKTTKRSLSGLTHELKNAENLQEQLSSIARKSPAIVIRPMIGTTEAIMKTLMGISNEIDPTYVVENEDKYGKDN